MIHWHVGAWFMMLVLFFVSYLLFKTGKPKGRKIVLMILRLFYILVVVTGGSLVIQYQFLPFTRLKGGLALVLIALMEMITMRTGKGKNTAMLWILFLIDLIAVLYIGYSHGS